MIKKEMIAMLLAGGQGSRLGVLTAKVAKPAVSFGGKYRIIDFPLSNCINSGVDTVGVLTQYQPLRLNTHIGIGMPWDLDRNVGGVTVLPPYEKSTNSEWYTGTANAIYQNLDYIDTYNPDYVLILSGDHIYKMDYEVMLDFHKENNADVTIAVMPVPMEEASRFGIMITDENNQITEFEEKPEHPRSNLASMGIYIFSWPILRNALIQLSNQQNCDFGKHIIPYCRDNGNRLFAFEFNGYWKDVGTLGSYWEANMELIDVIPEFNLYEEFWKIYTKSDAVPPQYISADSRIERSIITGGSEIYGDVYNSVIGSGVTIGKGTVVRDSIIMKNTTIGENCTIEKAIIAEEAEISDGVVMGIGDEVPNKVQPRIYSFGLVTVGENSYIPPNVKIGKNTAISGDTTPDDSVLFEALGGVWKLEDLKRIGSYRRDVRLVQLSFDVSFDEVRREYIDRGYWIDVDSGEISQTLSYRPIKALKYVKEEDTTFSLATVPEAYYYPGDLNRRVRWDACSLSPLTQEGIAQILGKAQPDIATAVKAFKNQAKNTLSDKYAAMLLPYSQIGILNEQIVLQDLAGKRIVLKDLPGEDGRSTVTALSMLPGAADAGAMFGILFYHEQDRRIYMQPLSLISSTEIVRLRY